MPDNTLFQDIQAGVKARLQTSDDFTGIPIYLEEMGDPVSQMEAALAKTGLAVYVANPVMLAESKDTPGPYFINIQVLVQIYEVVPVNRSDSGTGITAGGLALCAANLLHLHVPSGLGELSIAVDRPSITSTMEPQQQILIYNINLDTHGGLTST